MQHCPVSEPQPQGQGQGGEGAASHPDLCGVECCVSVAGDIVSLVADTACPNGIIRKQIQHVTM